MNFVRLLPVILSWIVLGAHFMRGGHHIVVAGCLLVPFLLLVRKPWVPPLMQLALFLGALEWIRVLMALAAMRQAHGMASGRMVAILGGVAVFTAASALVFLTPSLRQRYGFLHRPAQQPPAADAD